MHEEYERLNLADVIDGHPEKELLQEILIKPGIVSTLLSDGCYIAGGFGRTLMRGAPINDYLSGKLPTPANGPAGDIDIFFSDFSKSDMYRKVFNSGFRSFGRNALETHNNLGRIQLVDSAHLVLPVEEQLHRFDFTNACVAITRDHVFVNSRFKEIEKNSLLDVKSNKSPFLGSRIMKYFKHRGVSGVTPSSEPLITEWIMRALCDSFEKDADSQVESRGISYNVQALLREKSLTRPDDLLLALGRFKETEHTKYGITIETDFALSRLKDRGYEVTVPAH